MALKFSPISTPPAPASAPETKETSAHASGVDAHQPRGIRLFGHGADGEAEAGAAQQATSAPTSTRWPRE